MLSELKHISQKLFTWFLSFLICTLFFFSFGIKTISVFGNSFLVPYPTTTDSFSALLFKKITTDLLPKGVSLLVTSPLTGFLAQVKIALSLAFFTTFPFLAYIVTAYLEPALYRNEKNEIVKVVLPSFLLFLGGCIFAYYIIIPPTFSILYDFSDAIGAVPFFDVSELVSLVFMLTFVTGILFLLPIFMLLLIRLRIVSPDFWKQYWRHSIFFFLVVSAIITPDGSGVSMMLLTIPLVVLYGAGIFISSNNSLKVKSYKVIE